MARAGRRGTPGTGREDERRGLQHPYNKLATCLQLPCNHGTTPVQQRHCWGDAGVSRRWLGSDAGFPELPPAPPAGGILPFLIPAADDSSDLLVVIPSI